MSVALVLLTLLLVFSVLLLSLLVALSTWYQEATTRKPTKRRNLSLLVLSVLLSSFQHGRSQVFRLGPVTLPRKLRISSPIVVYNPAYRRQSFMKTNYQNSVRLRDGNHVCHAGGHVCSTYSANTGLTNSSSRNRPQYRLFRYRVCHYDYWECHKYRSWFSLASSCLLISRTLASVDDRR